MGTKSVLLALPGWAVDLERAKWLERLPLRHEDCQKMVLVWSCHQDRCTGNVCFQMDYPHGESLEARLARGPLEAEQGRKLCFSLVQMILRLQRTMFRLWGFLDASMVFLNEAGELSSVLPMGCLLSFEGAKSFALVALEQSGVHLPPEVERAVATDDQTLIQKPTMFVATDTYGVAALVLEAMAQAAPADVRDKAVMGRLPEDASDFLHKALYNDPDWRLYGRESLAHPWFGRKPSLSQPHRRSSKSPVPR